MIEDPDRWAPAYAEAGAGSVTFHVEAAAAPVRLARDAARRWARAPGMALKPATAIEPYVDLLPELDMLLIMTVEPGFGGQGSSTRCCPRSGAPSRRSATSTSGCRSTAASRRDRSSGAPRPALTSSSPAPPVYGAADPAEAIEALRAAGRGCRATARRCPLSR